MTIIPKDATKEEFCSYIVGKRGTLPDDELEDLWEWHCKLNSVIMNLGSTGPAHRANLPKDEQHLSLKEREKKIIADAQANGHEPQYAGRRWV